MRFYLHLLSMLLFICLLAACQDKQKKTVKTAAVTFTNEGSLEIYKKASDSLVVQLDVEFAESDYETQTGLMYRDGMKNNQAMLFIFPDEAMHAFYMKNTAFALDIIYIDGDLRIASFQENAEPFNENGLSSQVPIKYVLEVNAGLAQTWLLEVGDRIAYVKN